MRIAILALSEVFDTGLSAILDVFTTANELAELQGLPEARFELELVGLRREVRSAQGLLVPTRPPGPGSPEWAILPAIGRKMPEALVEALGGAEVGEAGELLRAWAGGGARVAAACVGTFVLAESGLLDGERATTTWWLAPLFRKRYPAVALEDSRMLVPSGRLLTAGAALGHLDLALHLLGRSSPGLAALTARYLIADARSSQSAYALGGPLAHGDPVVERFESWARGRLAAGFSLEEAARAAGASKRTLARRMEAVLGKTPLSYFQDLRIERALHLLRTGSDSVDRIAQELGYAEGSTLRNLLRRRLGKGLRELRGGPGWEAAAPAGRRRGGSPKGSIALGEGLENT